MENGTSSSILTDDRSTLPTTLNYRPTIDTDERPSSSSSMLGSPPSPAGSHRRRISYTPSYMSYHNGTSTPSQAIPISKTPLQSVQSRATETSHGLLLLAIAGDPEPSTISSLRALLKKHSFSGIAVIGSTEHGVEIKKLKMSILALIGKLGQELGVQTYLRNSWNESEVSASIQEALGNVHHVGSVMCYPSYNNPRTATQDILSFEQSDMEQSWRNSVGFLHSVAKATIPQLHKQDSEDSPLFLLMESASTTAASLIDKSACETLICGLVKDDPSSKLIIGRSETLLLPEPEPLQTNGTTSHEPAVHFDSEASDFKPGESPTKLWNMWSLQEQLESTD